MVKSRKEKKRVPENLRAVLQSKSVQKRSLTVKRASKVKAYLLEPTNKIFGSKKWIDGLLKAINEPGVITEEHIRIWMTTKKDVFEKADPPSQITDEKLAKGLKSRRDKMKPESAQSARLVNPGSSVVEDKIGTNKNQSVETESKLVLNLLTQTDANLQEHLLPIKSDSTANPYSEEISVSQVVEQVQEEDADAVLLEVLESLEKYFEETDPAELEAIEKTVQIPGTVENDASHANTSNSVIGSSEESFAIPIYYKVYSDVNNGKPNAEAGTSDWKPLLFGEAQFMDDHNSNSLSGEMKTAPVASVVLASQPSDLGENVIKFKKVLKAFDDLVFSFENFNGALNNPENEFSAKLCKLLKNEIHILGTNSLGLNY